MLKFAYRLIQCKGLIDGGPYLQGNLLEDIRKKFYFNKLSNFSANTFNYKFSECIEYNGRIFKVGFFLFTNSLKLFEIIDIALLEENIFVFCLEHKIGNFSKHFQSFPVIEKTQIYFCFDICYFKFTPIHTYVSPNGKTYIRPKYF